MILRIFARFLLPQQSAPHSASVDPEDVARFNRLAELWWDRNGKMGILHEINPIRVAYIRDHVRRFIRHDASALNAPGDRPLEGVRIADIGCGGGILSESLAQLGAHVTGVDPASNNVAIAKRHAETSGLHIDYRNITAEDLAAAGEQFDAVAALEVIEHVEGPREFIAMLGRLLKPGGLLFLATIDRTTKSYLLAIVAAEYMLGWVPKGTHNHDKFIRPDELSSWVRQGGMREIDRVGMSFQPLTRIWRKSHDTDVNYLMAARKDG